MTTISYSKDLSNVWFEPQDSLSPRQRKLKSFMKRSKETQIAWANFVVPYDRRVFDIKETEELRIFLTSILGVNEYLSSEPGGKDVTLIVERVKNSIVRVAKTCSTPGEIHLSVVLVFYYEYEKDEPNSMPVFKIYKKIYSKEAFFLDVYLETYNAWDRFLDKPSLPQSLICVPREGHYAWEPHSESLDLSYLIVSQQRNIPDLKIKLFHPELFPYFCEGIPRKLCQGIGKVTSTVIDFIKELMSSAHELTVTLRTKLECLIRSAQRRISESDLINELSALVPKNKLNFADVQELLKSLKGFKGDWNTIFEMFSKFCESETAHGLLVAVPYLPTILRILGLCFNVLCLFGNDKKESKEAHPSMACASSPLSHPIRLMVDDVFPKNIIVFPRATFPEVTTEFQKMFKNFTYKPQKASVFDVMDENNRVRATLFISSERFAFAYCNPNVE